MAFPGRPEDATAQTVRRMAVMEGERPVGVLSLGDAAIEKSPNSALGALSGTESTT